MPVFVNWLLRLVITNPICVRLVQGGSRRARHFYIRSGYLAALIIVLLFALLGRASGSSLSYQKLAAAGAVSFQTVSYLQVLLICLLTPIFMAGAIAQESSPRTWDIILTTPLSASQVVLGNLFGRLFFIIALLASSLPLFAVTQYFGGVPGLSIFMSYAIAGCSALLVGAIAVTLSVTRTGGRRAVFIFYTAVVAYLGATFAIDRILNIGVSPNEVTPVTAINPFLAMRVLLQPSNYLLPDPVELANMGPLAKLWFGSPATTYCLVVASASLFLMVFSTVTMRIIATHVGQIPWYRRLLKLGAQDSRTRPPHQVWSNPIAWREAFAKRQGLGKIVARWGFVLAGLVGLLTILASYHGGLFSAEEFRFTLVSVAGSELAIVVLAALNLSATAVSREREDGTLDLLLTTPITPSDYLYGKLRGLFTYLLPMTAVPAATLMLAGAYVLADGLGGSAGVQVQQQTLDGTTITVPLVLPEVLLAAPLVIFAFIGFCVMIGLQWSLKSKGTIGSVISTVAVILVILSVISFCGLQSGRSIPIVGTILAMLSPATMMYSAVFPVDSLRETIESGGIAAARLNVVIGAAIAAVAYTVIVYGMHTNMVRTFDMTVRKLTGTT
ncbi:MAG: ABC transporter permease [Phycisphaerales bacterium JB038]